MDSQKCVFRAKTRFLGMVLGIFDPNSIKLHFVIGLAYKTILELAYGWSGWISHQSALTNREICGSFLFLFVYSLFIEFVHVFTLNLCIFVAHGVVLNFLYKSLLIVVLNFCSVLGIWIVIDKYYLDSYLGWLSVSFWTLEIDLELTFTWVSELNSSLWLCCAERSLVQ